MRLCDVDLTNSLINRFTARSLCWSPRPFSSLTHTILNSLDLEFVVFNLNRPNYLLNDVELYIAIFCLLGMPILISLRSWAWFVATFILVFRDVPDSQDYVFFSEVLIFCESNYLASWPSILSILSPVERHRNPSHKLLSLVILIHTLHCIEGFSLMLFHCRFWTSSLIYKVMITWTSSWPLNIVLFKILILSWLVVLDEGLNHATS